MLTKIMKRVTDYLQCDHRILNERRLMSFISNNPYYLKDKPQTLQQGDFHPGNLIMTSGKKLGIVDFNHTDYDDQWEGFVRVPASIKIGNAPLAIGQINGYFDGSVPELFFPLLALYQAIEAHFCIVEAIAFGQAEVSRSLVRSRSVYENYNGFHTCIPIWYRGKQIYCNEA